MKTQTVLVDRVLSVLSFLNGNGISRRILAYPGISGADMATLRRINIR